MKAIITLIFAVLFTAILSAQTVEKTFKVYFDCNSATPKTEIPAEIAVGNVVSIVGYASSEGNSIDNHILSVARANSVADAIGFDTILNLRHVSGAGTTTQFGSSRSKNRVVVITYEVPEASKMTEFDCNPRTPITKREQRFNEKRDAKLAEIRAKDTSDYYVNIFGDTVNLDGTLRNNVDDANEEIIDTSKTFGCPIIQTVWLNKVDTFVKVDTITKTVTVMEHKHVVRFLMKERNMTRQQAKEHIDNMSRQGQTYDMETLKPLEKADSFKDLKKREAKPATKRKVTHKVTKRRPRPTKGKSVRGGILNWIAPNRNC